MKDEEAGPWANRVGSFGFGVEPTEGSGSVPVSSSSGNREKEQFSVGVLGSVLAAYCLASV